MISVVSGTYNRLPLLKRMVESARKSAANLPLEIVLVDGGSKDGTLQWAGKQDDVTLVEQGELLGAIKAYNAGFAVAAGDFVVIGNDDIEFLGDTIYRAHAYMVENPDVGQVAFKHEYQRRGPAARDGVVQNAFGYLYGQCSMVRKWLGDAAGWWGEDGMKTYGGDTRLSLRIWELGYPIVPVDGCAVRDDEYQDELREINSDTPWKQARQAGEPHPDLKRFNRKWRGRMIERGKWIGSAVSNRIIEKAIAGNLRSMRFKGQMFVGAPPRTALVDALSKYGPVRQVSQTDAVKKLGRDGYQKFAKQMIREFRPDLVIFQAQRENNLTPLTIREIRKERPWLYTVNWDGDTHYPLVPFHFEIARAVHLQLIVSPTLFHEYAKRGVSVGYWPIGIEKEYWKVKRDKIDGHDVLFLGALYGIGRFPEAEFRRDAVKILAAQSFDFGLFGPGWEQIGLTAGMTSEKHNESARLMARAKMTVSISQTKDLWGYTSDRLYNICATGCPAVVQRFKGMEHHGYIDGKTCIVFGTMDEMIDKIEYYLAHDNEREEIGRRGREMTLARHTWERRLDGLFAMIEGWVVT